MVAGARGRWGRAFLWSGVGTEMNGKWLSLRWSDETSRAPAWRRAANRAVAWWRGATFGTDRAALRVTVLAALGVITGLAEAAVVVLVVALAAGTNNGKLPLVDHLPDSSWTLAGLALAAVAVLALAHLASALIAARAVGSAERRLQGELVDTYLLASWPRQATARTGALQDLVTVKSAMVARGTQEAATALTAAANLLVVIAAAIAISPWAAGALLAVIALAAIVSFPFRAHTRHIATETASSSAELAVEVTEAGRAARDLRVFGVVDPVRGRLRDSIAAVARRQAKLLFAVTAAPTLTRDAAVAAMTIGVAAVVTRGDVSIAQLGAAVVLMLRGLTHSQGLSGLAYYLREREANLALIQDALRRWAPEGALGTRPCRSVRRIALDAVTYRYRDDQRPALSQVNLELEPREQLGIVGRTGAGKSTLAAILLGLIRPDSGEVLIDGVPLTDINPTDWHGRTAWIGQEPHLLTGTVRDNVRFMRRWISDDAILRAAHAASLSVEIGEWSLGLDHPAGPEGASLSGGQRQRVALARALAGDPDLLVLDEPTSALDVHAEAAIRDTLAHLRGEAIVVVIAHRLSTINACDRIAVMESGRIASVAPPTELAVGDRYFRDVLQLSDVHAWAGPSGQPGSTSR
jgi:ABC-type multidrug transport system fused ATPase/permease subunit